MEGRGNARHCYVSLHYGVIHHSCTDFGIIVSRGGFTKGAVEFARDKPILYSVACGTTGRMRSRMAIGYAEHRSRSHDAVIRVYDQAGNVIQKHEQKGHFEQPKVFHSQRVVFPAKNRFLNVSAFIGAEAY